MIKKTTLTILFFITINGCFTQSNFNVPKNHRLKLGISDIIARGNLALYYEQLITNRMSVEIGAGLTFDDYLAVYFWKGDQYIYRNKFADTRFSYSFGYKYVPFPKLNFLYIGLATHYRRYYSSDRNAFFQYNGMLVGSDRKETSFKLVIGNLFSFSEDRLCIDYSLGFGLFISKDKWNILNNSYPTFNSGNERKERGSLFFSLKMGI